MDFRQIRYFMAVAELESFRRASDHLHVAQSALSRHVMELEQRVGAPLFERLARGVRLTAVGQAFYGEAEAALARLDRAFERSRRAAHGELGRLTIAMNEMSARNLLVGRCLRRFRENFPDIELELVSLNSMQQTPALQDGEIDAGFLIERTEGLGLDYLRIAEDPFVIALPNKHRLARQRTLTAAMLSEEPFVAPKAATYWLPQMQLLARCRALGLVPRIVQETGTEQMQINFIRSGMGVGFLNASIQDNLPPDLVLRPVDQLDVKLGLDLVWRRDSGSAPLKLFVRVMRAECQASGYQP